MELFSVLGSHFDQEALIFYEALGYAIACNRFESDPVQHKRAVEMWRELNEIFGEEQWADLSVLDMPITEEHIRIANQLDNERDY